jgi:hypothetical protein
MSKSQEAKKKFTFEQAQEYMKSAGPTVNRLVLCGRKAETTAVLGYTPDVNDTIDALSPSEVEWVRVLDTGTAREKKMLWYAAVVLTLNQLNGYELQSVVASWPVEFIAVLPYVARFKAHNRLDLTEEEEEAFTMEQGAGDYDYDALFEMFTLPDYVYEEDPSEGGSEQERLTVYWLSIMMKLPLESIAFFSALIQERRAASAA